MNKTIDLINDIISELVDRTSNLSDTFLKVQLLALQIKNEKLKEWTDNELNGYVGKIVPEYRKIPANVRGNIMQDIGFGNSRSQDNIPLPIEYLDKELLDYLISIRFTSSISEIEHLINENGKPQINIPHVIHREISKLFNNGWVVQFAWQNITINSLKGIISSIKSNLLTFLVELAEEIGETDKINFMEKKKDIDKLFDKTIGNISGENINITIGSDTNQTVNHGDNVNLNVAKGENINQSITGEIKNELQNFILDLKRNLPNIKFNNEDDFQDFTNEISQVELQLNRESPKKNIIGKSLSIIANLLMSVAGNALTPPILEKISWLSDRLLQ